MNEKIETYAIEVIRPEGLTDAQWQRFCGLMEEEDFENKCLWDTVDELTSQAKKNSNA